MNIPLDLPDIQVFPNDFSIDLSATRTILK